MLKRSSFSLMLVVAAIFFASTAIAEKVEHHGSAVEAEGTVESCIACHDGSIAGSVGFCTTECNVTTAHAINKRYPPKGKKTSYASARAVKAKGIRLANGMVTCISCHDLKNRVFDHLILDEKGRLCAVCHIEQGNSLIGRKNMIEHNGGGVDKK
jgi:predicted CXXCH cytochrome family protein